MSNSPDDDRTIIRSTPPGPSDSPSAASAGEGISHGLPFGTRISEFEITRPIGEGGFSIVYLAWDHSLERQVALKEYMPSSIATRLGDTRVAPRSERHRHTFDAGLKSFVNEGKLLAHFDHPSLVKVHRFWEANGTAYMAMPFYEGPTLKAHLLSLSQPPSEGWLKDLLAPLLDALQTLHADECYHRDIAPDNILLLGRSFKPLLLDFGAARRVIGDATQALTVILKPGYAPVEQYAETASMKQGAWTDIYALCAVVYHAICGRPPAPSVGRLAKDELVAAAVIGRGRYSAPFLAAIDAGLAVRPEDRPQNVAALRTRLFGEDRPSNDQVTLIRPAPGTRSGATPAPQAGGAAKRKRTILWGVFAAAGLVIAAFVAWVANQRPFGHDASILAAPARSSPAAAGTAPAVADRSAVPVQPSPSAQKAVAPARAFSLRAVLDEIVGRADPAISVSVQPVKPTVAIGKDKVRLTVRSNAAGYVYVLYAGTGSSPISLVFPNAKEPDNQIRANRNIVVGKGIDLNAEGPPGDDHILAIVSPAQRDFSGIGFKPSLDPKNPVGEFATDTLRRAWPPSPDASSPYAGVPVCRGDGPCSAKFGAAITRVIEVDPADLQKPYR